MKNIKQFIMTGILGVIFLSSSASAADQLPKSLVKMKTGTCEFTVFHSDGIKPANGINIQIIAADSKENTVLSGSITDKQGNAQVDVAEDGRYILSVNETMVALLQTSASEAKSDYRIVLPASGLLVGGADEDGAEESDEEEAEEEEEDEVAAYDQKKKKITAVIAAAVVAGAIILIADDDDDNNNTGTTDTPGGSSSDLLGLDRVPDDVRAAFARGDDRLKAAILSDIEAGGSGRAAIQRASNPPSDPTPVQTTPRVDRVLSNPTPPPAPAPTSP
jgi:hypothetical protein